ncbi:ABC transporter ATP-binding protein [Photobacterium galatheae]|uniref:ABC transporter ATP-binding protein n=1 Tax=Photobacterium galatheae TaxID=1654360 RepID=A0A066RSZ6_9GAMM|nr:hypothetical protein EA58_15615 [Photobacterium galatheae]MCM0149859.1 ABC transporter ATP-binding protein [Photobacterium galatheae]
MDNSNIAHHRLPISDTAKVRRKFCYLIGREKRHAFWIVLLYLVAAVAGVFIPVALGYIIDGISLGWSVNDVDLVCFALLVSIVVQLFASRFGYRMGHRFGERTAAYLRETTLKRALQIPLVTIERAGLGDISTRTSGDVNAVANVLRNTGPGVVAAIIELGVLVIAAFMVAPMMSLLLLSVVPPLFFVARVYVKQANPAFARERAGMADIAESISATETGAQTVMTHQLGEKRQKIGSVAIDNHWRNLKKIVNLQTWFIPSLDFAHIIPVIGILVAGGLWALSGGMSVGAVVACAMIAYRTAAPIERIMYSLTEIQSATAALARIEGLTEIPVDDRTLTTEQSQIELRDMHFSYENGPEVLQIEKLDISPGSHLVIVGSSGSGKSTLARVIAGIERPTAGYAKLGHVNAADLELTCLRKKVILITQETYVFAATLRENLSFTETPTDDQHMWDALQLVGAHWAFDLCGGLDAMIETDDVYLTTGQKQQITLARAIVANPDIIIFDESFAALDIQSKGELEESVFSILKEKTVIVIAHKLDVISEHTRVLVMAEGKIVEDGVHERLLEQDGIYSNLWKSWRAE